MSPGFTKPLIYDNNTRMLILVIIPELKSSLKENPYLQKKRQMIKLQLKIRNHSGS